MRPDLFLVVQDGLRHGIGEQLLDALGVTRAVLRAAHGLTFYPVRRGDSSSRCLTAARRVSALGPREGAVTLHAEDADITSPGSVLEGRCLMSLDQGGDASLLREDLGSPLGRLVSMAAAADSSHECDACHHTEHAPNLACPVLVDMPRRPARPDRGHVPIALGTGRARDLPGQVALFREYSPA